MFRIISLVIVALIFRMTTAVSQPLHTFGVKAGFTSASQSYSLIMASLNPGMDRRKGISVSAFVEWFNPDPFSIVTEIAYTQKGMGMHFTETGSGGFPISEFTVFNRLDYLSLPILAKVRVDTGSVIPYFIAGPRVDYFLGYSSDQNLFNAVYDQFKKISYGGTIGFGARTTTLIANPVFIEFRYNADFMDSFKTESLEVSNNTFDILVGIEI